jgi:hypothetical protein
VAWRRNPPAGEHTRVTTEQEASTFNPRAARSIGLLAGEVTILWSQEFYGLTKIVDRWKNMSKIHYSLIFFDKEVNGFVSMTSSITVLDIFIFDRNTDFLVC